jgi:phosphoglycerate dehydrogenase-like enzyme
MTSADPRARIFVGLDSSIRGVLFQASAWARLEALGRVDVMDDGATSLPERLCDEYDVLITGWGTPKLERLDGDRLKLIVHSAGSWRVVITDEVLAGEVAVTQAGSDPMARAVAEFALTMSLVLLRHVHSYDRQLQGSRDYAASRTPEYGAGIHAVRHGLVGLSRVGLWHARMLQGLGCEDVVAFDPYFPAEEAAALGVRLAGLDEVMASDVVALHAPVTPETQRMIGARELALMPDGAILINTARAAIVDGEALEQELVAGRIRAGLDVFDEEPLPAGSPLYGLPNVLLAPHVAGATTHARLQQGDTVVDETERHLNGEPLRFRIDPSRAAQLS